MSQGEKNNAFSNPGFNPNLDPPPYDHQPGYDRYAGPVQSVAIAMPPEHTGGLFLDPDQPIVVPPSAVTASPRAALEYLKNVSTLLVKQKIDMVEILTSFDTQNRFTLFDQQGQTVFYALEDSDCLVRQCCGPARPFDMKILDIYQNEVIHLYRPLACAGCCFPCCLMNIEVTSPPGNIVGKVQQEWSIIFPKFSIQNAVGETVLMIDGPCWMCSCGGDIVFRVLSADGETQVGQIKRKWPGILQQLCTDADNFSIDFPENLDLNTKTVLVGAIFLIDVMYFERKK